MKTTRKIERARDSANADTSGFVPRRRWWSALFVLAVFGILVVGVWTYVKLPHVSTSAGSGATYGEPGNTSIPITSIQNAIDASRAGSTKLVTLSGAVSDMGPVMGCWLRIRDGSNAEVLAQTDPMVYMPQNLRGATVRVTGTLSRRFFSTMGFSGQSWVLLTSAVDVLDAPHSNR